MSDNRHFKEELQELLGLHAAMLTDGNEVNGEVTFPSGDTRIRVVSPAARVQFGMANVMGFDDTCVSSVSTARIA